MNILKINFISIYLISLVFLFVGKTYADTEVDRNYKSIEFLALSQATITEAYESSQYLGFAVANHETKVAIDRIIHLLKTKIAADLDFKYIFLEMPGELNETLYNFSTGVFPLKHMPLHMNNFWYEHYSKSSQYNYIFKNLFPIVQKINKNRPNNPIIISAIDGVSKFTYEIDLYRIKNKLKYIYLGSIDREERTAANFIEATSKDENKKGLIFYHYAHLLKQTKAMGLDYELKEYKYTSLGWLDMVITQLPEISENVHVILFDEADDKYNPDGVIVNGQFAPNAYIRRYRNKTIITPEDIFECFDSLIQF